MILWRMWTVVLAVFVALGWHESTVTGSGLWWLSLGVAVGLLPVIWLVGRWESEGSGGTR